MKSSTLFFLLFGAVRLSCQVIDSTFGIPTSVDPCCLPYGITGCNFGGADQAFSAVHLDDGRIILAGDTRWQGESDFAIARLLPDGQYDQTAGPDGQVRIDLGYPNDSCLAAARYQNNWILMGGCVYQSGTTGYVNLIARIDLDGKLDPSFGSGGYAVINLPTAQHEMITKIRPLTDGRIIIAGNTLHGSVNWPDSAGTFLGRLLANGQIDSSFGIGGFIFPRWELGCNASLLGDAVLDSEGRIIITGATYEPSLGDQEGTTDCFHNIFLLRYLSDGQPDPNFGNNGLMELPNTAKGRGNVILPYEDGRILLAGAAGDLLLSLPAYAFLARFMSDGIPDLTFGEEGRIKKGILNYGLSGGFVEPFGLMRMRDRILVGVSNNITGDDPGFGVICFAEDGKIDSTFGKQGRFNTFPDLPLQSYINEISRTSDNGFFLSGYTRILQPDNMAIVKIRWDKVSKISEHSSLSNVKIYPNPVNDGLFHLDLGNPNAIEDYLLLKIRDINGSILYEQDNIVASVTINTTDFPTGLYLVELFGQTSRYLGKLVVQEK
jgi:uncharacterized delta-60 repeat protein